MDRISSGNPQLDLILEGGLPRGSINILMGLPGSGKTVLAEQMAFANASRERPVLYLTTLSEPLSKVITYLQELEFADVDLVGTQVVYESLAEELKAGPTNLPAHMLQLIQRHRPGLIIVDSFKAVADMVPNPQDWRGMVFELAGLLSAYDATTLWVGEYSAEMIPNLVEFAVADGILALRREQSGARDDRFLRVAKLRGSAFRDGDHVFTISRTGLRFAPRLVTPDEIEPYAPVGERIPTGVAGLDDMIDQGWLRGSATLVSGPSGAGKSMLGLHFLRKGVEQGEPGLLVGFQENPTQIGRAMKSLGWDPTALLGPGKMDILYKSPVELQVDAIVEEVFERIKTHGVQRVVIDALGDLERAARTPHRFSEYVYSLIKWFAAHGATSMLVLEAPGPIRAGQEPFGRAISNMSDNVVSLSMELDDDLVRTIRILKTRGSAHDGRKHTLRITPLGMVVE